MRLGSILFIVVSIFVVNGLLSSTNAGNTISFWNSKMPNRALIREVKAGNEHAVKELLNSGASINTRDSSGYTPLMYAIRYQHIKLVNLLLYSGADVNARDNDGETVLMLATRVGNKQVVELLLQNKADVNATGAYKRTALHWAAEMNRACIARLLIQYGASKEAQSQGMTALDLARGYKFHQTARSISETTINHELIS